MLNQCRCIDKECQTIADAVDVIERIAKLEQGQGNQDTKRTNTGRCYSCNSPDNFIRNWQNKHNQNRARGNFKATKDKTHLIIITRETTDSSGSIGRRLLTGGHIGETDDNWDDGFYTNGLIYGFSVNVLQCKEHEKLLLYMDDIISVSETFEEGLGSDGETDKIQLEETDLIYNELPENEQPISRVEIVRLCTRSQTENQSSDTPSGYCIEEWDPGSIRQCQLEDPDMSLIVTYLEEKKINLTWTKSQKEHHSKKP
ncbi:unnamed protein product [Mytilus coruscus]|uniref:Uncharacterized protein n=1 Tax=Mytilus coruscus TaxID=42192 RepID=A0A6J8DM03_MYTCO|nr:unnamed protein product [Mytilus coruscus]